MLIYPAIDVVQLVRERNVDTLQDNHTRESPSSINLTISPPQLWSLRGNTWTKFCAVWFHLSVQHVPEHHSMFYFWLAVSITLYSHGPDIVLLLNGDSMQLLNKAMKMMQTQKTCPQVEELKTSIVLHS
jgi:hypothetical protein